MSHEPLKQATLCFLVKDENVLLAMKKRGFGVGKYNGIGGKKNTEETIEAAAIREADEEIKVRVRRLRKVATLNCQFPENPDWGQRVTVYLVDEWEGEPIETEEMAPKWFNKNELPFNQMWPDEEQWLPLILDHNHIEADYIFDKDGKIINHSLRRIE
jgi:8-oxo-dGTP diphosphatase/8-oxo-dGTP diphosphatase/2-hydroxy-dATP diphosphatase